MHDRNGSPLKVGDLVMVPCRVTSVSDGVETYCNVTVQTVIPMFTGDESKPGHRDSITLNARQVEKAAG